MLLTTTHPAWVRHSAPGIGPHQLCTPALPLSPLLLSPTCFQSRAKHALNNGPHTPHHSWRPSPTIPSATGDAGRVASPTPSVSSSASSRNDQPQAQAPPNPSVKKKNERYTLSMTYLGGKNPEGWKEVDHMSKRKERDIKDIVEAARKIGLSEDEVRSGVSKLESLLPDLAPNMDRMRASDWVKLVANVPRVAALLITLKTHFPGADVSKIVALSPKLLLKDVVRVDQDAAKVKQALASAHNVDAIIEAVPALLDPGALAQSLSNLSTWFKTDDPVAVLEKNPKLLLNVEEADLEADPLYDWVP